MQPAHSKQQHETSKHPPNTTPTGNPKRRVTPVPSGRMPLATPDRETHQSSSPNSPFRALHGRYGRCSGWPLVAAISSPKTTRFAANPCASPARVSLSFPVSWLRPLGPGSQAAALRVPGTPKAFYSIEWSFGVQFWGCSGLCVPAGWLGCGSPAWGSVPFLLFSAFCRGGSRVCFSFFCCCPCCGCSGCCCCSGSCGCVCGCGLCCFGGCCGWGCLGRGCASSFPACSWGCSVGAVGALVLVFFVVVGSCLCSGLVGSGGSLSAGAWVASCGLLGLGSSRGRSCFVGGFLFLSCCWPGCGAVVLGSLAWLVGLGRAVVLGVASAAPFLFSCAAIFKSQRVITVDTLNCTRNNSQEHTTAPLATLGHNIACVHLKHPFEFYMVNNDKKEKRWVIRIERTSSKTQPIFSHVKANVPLVWIYS